MFTVTVKGKNVVALRGRLDASQVEVARQEFDKITESALIDFKELEYISSAGLGILFAAQKRLKSEGHGLKLVNLNNHIRDVFRYARFEMIFEIE